LFLFAALLGCAGDSSSDPKETDREPRQVGQGDRKQEKIPRAELPNWEKLEVTPRPATKNDWFEDVTEQSGVTFSYRDGQQSGFYQLIESLGGGVALFDYDNDGDVDLFLTGGGSLNGPPIRIEGLPCALYRNEGDFQFKEVTQQIGLGDSSLYTHGCAVGDFDRDGWQDLFVAGYAGCRLYRNEAGERFHDVTQDSALACPGWNVTACWLDIDNDGWLDLYVLTYADWKPDHTRQCINNLGMKDICSPKVFSGICDQLWRNNTDGTFTDISKVAGITEKNLGLGVVAADLDGNGYTDIYVANDVGENFLYLNDGKLPLSSKGTLYGVARDLGGEQEGSMGAVLGAFDGEGWRVIW